MSERQVQYTDGSWSREVEAGDDLLDEALAVADECSAADARILRALVERVQQAEAGREQYSALWQQAGMSVLRLTDERDEARGKLDKVRHEVEHWRAMIRTGSGEYVDGTTDAYDRVLAILDGK